ncbi:MAG: PDZ domain-containing protein [Bacteroidota bacterium]
MKILITLLFAVVLQSTSVAQQIHYRLSMPKPQNHYFEVEMELSNFKDKVLNVKMPVWAPGSYLVREFAKNVNVVTAFDENNKALKVEKQAKNNWSIEKGKAKKVVVRYQVYAFELSVRTSFLDLTHGYVSGSGVFMYVDKFKEKAGTLTVDPFENFKKVSTGMPFDGKVGAAWNYHFDNYDQLVDCPLEIGNQEEFSFTAAGVKHTVAMYGEGNFDVERLKVDMAEIIEAETKVFGENPNKEYTFIIHNVVDGQGGLEHCNSTTLSVNRWTYSDESYDGFLSLVAHEYFHLWNVKRIRPLELGPFNYDEENYTTLLWVMEGFTSYYDELILRRVGLYDMNKMASKVQSSVNYVEGSIGSRVQPLAHASYDAWIKSYRPNENSSNTQMTYYSRGAVIASIFDAKIIAKYNGEKCLDHFMKHLYDKFYKKLNRGFTENEFKTEIATFLGENLDEFWAKYIHGTEIIPYAEYFAKIGVTVTDKSSEVVSSGLSLTESGGKVTVRGIRAGSAAEDAGLSVNDEIIGCNGYRVSQASLEGTLNSLEVGEQAELLISRDQVLYGIEFFMNSYTRPQFSFTVDASNKLAQYWLRED